MTWNYMTVDEANQKEASLRIEAVIRHMTWRVSWRREARKLGVAVLLLLAAVSPTFGQAHLRPCPPVSERTGEPGPTCSTASQKLGRLPQGPIFWHLDTYPTRAAAEAAKGPRGTVVESLGKIWLFTIAEAGWRPSGGERVAEIGPLPVKPDTEYTAVYLESIFDPGMTAPVHTHSGPEAFYTLTGETCLEVPDGVLRERGDSHAIVVPSGPPMLLTAASTVRRRGVVLILHDSSQPATTMGSDWTPKGLCKTSPR
jgi:quercetin dioxygenase-like cupin family protein